MFKEIFLAARRKFAQTYLVGEINNRIFSPPIILKSEKFGDSTNYQFVSEFKIDKNNTLLENVWSILKSYFDFDFIFNVSFSCAKPYLSQRDRYADPYSIWFNIFLGYYQIDISTKERDLPFAFSKIGLEEKLNLDEIIKIGKADWNLFSNFLYGVPKDELLEYCKINKRDKDYISVKKVKIEGYQLWEVIVNSIEVVTAYQSNVGKELNEELANSIWQTVFGSPSSREEFPESFIPANMKVVLYLNYQIIENDPDIKEPMWSTNIFGGTINLDYPKNMMKNPHNEKTLEELTADNELFLEEQLIEIKKMIPIILKKR